MPKDFSKAFPKLGKSGRATAPRSNPANPAKHSFRKWRSSLGGGDGLQLPPKLQYRFHGAKDREEQAQAAIPHLSAMGDSTSVRRARRVAKAGGSVRRQTEALSRSIGRGLRNIDAGTRKAPRFR